MKESDFQGIPNINAAHQGPLAATNTATALRTLATIHAETRVVKIQIDAEPMRYTVNGTTPNATLGFRAVAGERIRLSREEADNCLMIREGATNSTFQVAQYRD